MVIIIDIVIAIMVVMVVVVLMDMVIVLVLVTVMLAIVAAAVAVAVAEELDPRVPGHPYFGEPPQRPHPPAVPFRPKPAVLPRREAAERCLRVAASGAEYQEGSHGEALRLLRRPPTQRRKLLHPCMRVVPQEPSRSELAAVAAAEPVRG